MSRGTLLAGGSASSNVWPIFEDTFLNRSLGPGSEPAQLGYASSRAGPYQEGDTSEDVAEGYSIAVDADGLTLSMESNVDHFMTGNGVNYFISMPTAPGVVPALYEGYLEVTFHNANWVLYISQSLTSSPNYSAQIGQTYGSDPTDGYAAMFAVPGGDFAQTTLVFATETRYALRWRWDQSSLIEQVRAWAVADGEPSTWSTLSIASDVPLPSPSLLGLLFQNQDFTAPDELHWNAGSITLHYIKITASGPS